MNARRRASLRSRLVERDTIAVEDLRPRRVSSCQAVNVNGVETDLLLRSLSLARARALDAVATLDNICLQAYRSWTTVQLEEEATGIAQNRADFVAPPERCGRRGAILTSGLLGFTIIVSHHLGGGLHGEVCGWCCRERFRL